MASAVIARLVWRGVVEARGFYFSDQVLEEAETRRRLLTLWRPDALIQPVEGGWLLMLGNHQEVDCARSPGAPLVRVGERLTAAPLLASELEALPPLADSVVLVRNAQPVPLLAGPSVDPAGWVDVGDLVAVPMRTLGADPRPSSPLLGAPSAFHTRQRMKVPPASPQLAKLLESLRTPPPPDPSKPKGAAKGPFETMADWLQQSPPGKGLWRMLAGVGALRPLMQAQARFIMDFIDMLERGDFDQGLRHAIPFSDQNVPASALFNLPLPRKDLLINLIQRPAGGGINLSADTYRYLRRLYRQVYEKLLAAGRIDEAVFVLAELLNAPQEAVSLLERQGQLRLAAELAEGRKLPPSLVVRQWFLAGDVARALLIAHRSGAYADACRRLEATHPQEALTWRQLWAQHLVASGRHAEAVDVLWNRPGLQELWFIIAIGGGGRSGARTLARYLRWKQEDSLFVRSAVTALADEGREGAPARQAFLDEMAQEEVTAVLRPMAVSMMRAAIRDVQAGSVAAADLRGWVKWCGDGPFRSDLPPLDVKSGVPLATRAQPLEYRVEAAERGLVGVHDAAILTFGWCAVALGEMGLRILNAAGRTVHHFDIPAWRLVVSDNGSRLLVLAPRGEVWRLHRLEVTAPRTPPLWDEVLMDGFADDFDGSRWLMVSRAELLAVDTTAARFQPLCRLTEVHGRPRTVVRNRERGAYLGWSAQGGWESIEFSDDLQVRRTHSGANWDDGGPHTVLPDGRLVGLMEGIVLKVVHPWRTAVATGAESGPLGVPNGAILLDVVGTQSWIAAAAADGANVLCWLRPLTPSHPTAILRLEGASKVRLRLTDEHLVACDDLGRVLCVELRGGALTRNYRMTL